jgi:hypothetical protein
MTRPGLPGTAGALLAILLIVVPGTAAQAQLGGLIKKKASQAAPVPSVGEPVAFDDVILELTPERVGKVIAGKKEAKRLADGPDGPAAIRERLDALDLRQAKIYEKHVDAINASDVTRQDAERCRDSSLAVIKDKLNLDTPGYRQKMMAVALRLAQAQARGDSAEMRRLQEEVVRAGEPSPADSARVVQGCPLPPPPPAVQEWTTIKAEMEKVRQELGPSQQAVTAAEESTSGMNHRQLGMACERIGLYLGRANAKARQTGFTSAELEALGDAVKELQGICT